MSARETAISIFAVLQVSEVLQVSQKRGPEVMKTKQEQAFERFQEWESRARIRQEVADAAKAYAEKPDSALELLHSPDFFPYLLADLEKAGLVGEKRNALATWIVGTSRLRNKPLNEIIKGHSSSGKNHLAKTVLKFFPDEAVVTASSLSERAMNYIGKNALSHKIFYVDELRSVNRNHPARQLISEGRIIHRVTAMENGQRTTLEKVTEGPVACITTTTATALEIDDESRNFSLWINETYDQTKAISKALVARDRETLHPARLALWHAVQHLVAKIRHVPIVTPPWFDLLVEHILPYGDLRIRRYWPGFVEATRVVCMIHAARTGREQLERQGELIVSFDDFAMATHIFDRIIAQSLTRSGRDEDLATADIVERLSRTGLYGQGVSAGDLVGEPGIRSLDRAYRLLSRAAHAGTIIRINPTQKNNDKLYIRAAQAEFLGDPALIHRKLKLRIAGRYIHPINGKYCPYGM
jgi:hypothetical protein